MRVVIVDDESIVRIGLTSIINWESYGFQLVGQASDGSKAYDLIIEQEPDIVITDIKMPVMDGLELIKSFKGLNTAPRFIVLSSYDDFYLVKEAMKWGVEDYILKLEIQPDILINILKNVAIKIKKERERVLEKSCVDKQITKSLKTIRRNFFKDIINNQYENDMELNQAMELFNIQVVSEYIYCLTIKVGELHRFESVTHEELFVLNTSIINICEEIINDDFNGYCFEGKTGEFFVLLSHKTNTSERICEEKLVDLAERLHLMLEQYLNINPIIGIGEGKNGLEGILDAFRKSLDAVGESFYKNDDLINYLEKEDKSVYLLHIKRAIEYMSNNFTQDISLKEVAEEVGLNPSYFSTLLKKYTDLSYSDHITQMRVNEAQKLLSKSNNKIYEVGEKVGYHNNYYFNRIFKKMTGLTPGQYRKKIILQMKNRAIFQEG